MIAKAKDSLKRIFKNSSRSIWRGFGESGGVLRDEDISQIGSAVAAAIQRRRNALGLSKSALAQKAGVSIQAVSFIEKSVNSPSLSTLLRICDALQTGVPELLAEAMKERRPGDPLSEGQGGPSQRPQSR